MSKKSKCKIVKGLTASMESACASKPFKNKYDQLFDKMNGGLIVGAKFGQSDGLPWCCEYVPRDADLCPTESAALLRMAEMLREDAQVIEEYLKK